MIDGEKVHPTFLYESLWCLILFFVLSAVDKRRKFKGQAAFLYGVLYLSLIHILELHGVTYPEPVRVKDPQIPPCWTQEI